ncbi:MAG: hypothetical protein DWH91_07345 [Planctomycetota bacterium]|nr:MAG: hypothetical protein DWH91_07345 [Planctomycetota bacterium]
MRWYQRTLGLAAALCVSFSSMAQADQLGLTEGGVELHSANVLAFGPYGVLFVGDAKAARVYAIQTGDLKGDPAKVTINIEGAASKIAAALGASTVEIADMAVNPLTGSVFVSTMADGKVQLVQIGPDGKIARLALDKVAHAKLDIPNPPEDKVVGEGRRARNNRPNSVTDLAFVDGRLLLSGISQGDTPSTVRAFDFPFNDKAAATGLEIYHGAHGQLENYAPIRTFVPFIINGEANVLAGFVCTPLVKFPVASIGAGEQVRGTTVAELGNRNQPLDMIAYKKEGKDYLLLANSARGVMKISTEDLDKAAGIESKVAETAGQKYETVAEWQGVVQLDLLNEGHAIVLVKNEGGQGDLRTWVLP